LHTHLLKSLDRVAVASDIPLNLSIPKVGVGLSFACSTAAVAMPETAVYEDRHAQPPYIQIGAARKIFAVKPISNAK
jgi:hypothetical protein